MEVGQQWQLCGWNFDHSAALVCWLQCRQAPHLLQTVGQHRQLSAGCRQLIVEAGGVTGVCGEAPSGRRAALLKIATAETLGVRAVPLGHPSIAAGAPRCCRQRQPYHKGQPVANPWSHLQCQETNKQL